MINPSDLVRHTCQDLLDILSRNKDIDSDIKRYLSLRIAEIFRRSQDPDDFRSLQDQFDLDSFQDMSKSKAEFALASRIIMEISEGIASSQISPIQMLLIDKLAQQKLKEVRFADSAEAADGERGNAYLKRAMKEASRQTFEKLAEEKPGRISRVNMKNMFRNYADSVELPAKEYLLEVFLETLDDCKYDDIEPDGFQARFMEKAMAQNVIKKKLSPDAFKSMYKLGWIVQDSESRLLFEKAESGAWKDGEREAELIQMKDHQIDELKEKSSELFKSKSFQECLKIFLKPSG